MREPGDDDDAGEEADDEADLVPLGDVLVALDKERESTAQETAMDLLRRSTREMPHAVDCERAVLGSILLVPSAFELAIAEGLKAAHFFRSHHGTVFDVIARLHATKQPIDTLTVVDELLRIGKLEAVGGAAAISQLEALLPTAHHIGAYAKLVVEKAQLRALIDAGTKQVASAFAQNKSASQIVHSGRQDLDTIERGVTTTRGLTGEPLAKRIMASIRKEGTAPSYVPTGIPVIDDSVGGVPRGGFMVFAAERKCGKTTTVGHIALNAIDNGFKVGVWSFEMMEHELGGVIAGQKAGVHLEQNKILSPREMAAMDLASQWIAEVPLHINAPPGLTAEELAAQLYAYKHRHDLDLVIIENLQGIQLSTRYDQLQANHAHVSNTMRRTIKDLGVAAIFMSQVKTQSEDAKKSGRTPKDDAVPQSNAWADDAYLMVVASRHKHSPDPRIRSTVKVEVVASRVNGDCPVGFMRYDPRTGRLDVNADPVDFGDDRDHPKPRTVRRKPPAFGTANVADPTDHDSRF